MRRRDLAPVPAATPAGREAAPVLADVLSVETGGALGVVTFAVEIRSPDSGCDRYADWWEVVSPDGVLLGRRVLDHSHVDEQPFARSGEVSVQADEVVIVRAHLHPDGYGGRAMKGSVRDGFAEVTLPPGFAANLASVGARPERCLF